MNNVFKNKYPLLDTLVYSKSNNWGDIYTDSYREECSKSYSKFIDSKFEETPFIKNYFNFGMHDSWVTNMHFNREQLEITFNDFQTHCFVDALIEVSNEKIQHKKRVLPVILRFNNIKKLSVAWVNKNSKIIFLNKNRYLPKLKEYLYEQVVTFEPDKISVGILFWSDLKGNKSYLLVEIECGNLSIEEQQRNAFIQLFDGNHVELYDLYKVQRNNGLCFDFSTSLEFIKKYIGNQGK